MATMRDVAKRAAVSIATVSAVINSSAYVSPELRQRVIEVCKLLNYHPNEVARSLKNKRTHAIGVVIPDISNPFFTSLIRGIEDAANRNGFAVILGNTDENQEKENIYFRVLRSRNIDGIIIATASLGRKYFDNRALEFLPLVFVNRVPSEPYANIVAIDNFKAAFDATSYLLKFGHRRIGIITGLPKLSTSEERLRGYKEALKVANMPISNLLIKSGNARVDGGFEKGLELLSLKRPPTAIFATNNLMTLGVIKALKKEGLSCPKDMSVVGFDDFDWTDAFSPRITTVAQPTYEMGLKASELLIRNIRGEINEPEKIILQPNLIIRESCSHI